MSVVLPLLTVSDTLFHEGNMFYILFRSCGVLSKSRQYEGFRNAAGLSHNYKEDNSVYIK